jgi:hypothetical protein
MDDKMGFTLDCRVVSVATAVVGFYVCNPILLARLWHDSDFDGIVVIDGLTS